MWGQGLLAQDLLQGSQAWVKAARVLDLGVNLCFVDRYGQSLGLSCDPGPGRRPLLT